VDATVQFPDQFAQFPDEFAFLSADVRRRRSAEVDLGATWRFARGADAWKLTWLSETGELYLCRSDGHAGSCSDVSVLAMLSEPDLDALLDGWRDHRADEDGLGWVLSRLPAAAA